MHQTAPSLTPGHRKTVLLWKFLFPKNTVPGLNTIQIPEKQTLGHEPLSCNLYIGTFLTYLILFVFLRSNVRRIHAADLTLVQQLLPYMHFIVAGAEQFIVTADPQIGIHILGFHI